MHNFKIYLENFSDNAADGFTISINDCIIKEYSIDSNIIEFDCDLVQGLNSLKIKFTRISTDAFIRVDEIYINDSAMKYLLNDYGAVIPNWQAEPMLQQWYINNQGQAPDRFLKRKILDMSGEYIFQFQTPLREFLENFYKIPEYYKHQYNQPLESYSKLEEMLHNAKTK
jgi:hypothetical protein